MGAKETKLKIKILAEQQKNIIKEESKRLNNKFIETKESYKKQFDQEVSNAKSMFKENIDNIKEIDNLIVKKFKDCKEDSKIFINEIKETFSNNSFSKGYIYKNSFLRELDNLKNFTNLTKEEKKIYYDKIENEATRMATKYNIDINIFRRTSLIAYYNNLSNLYEDIFKAKLPSNFLKEILKRNFDNLKDFINEKFKGDVLLETLLASLVVLNNIIEKYTTDANNFNFNMAELQKASESCLIDIQNKFLPQLDLPKEIEKEDEAYISSSNNLLNLDNVDNAKLCQTNSNKQLGYLNIYEDIDCNKTENGLEPIKLSDDLDNEKLDFSNKDVIIRNSTSQKFNINININQTIKVGQSLGILDNKKIICPVDGQISKITEKEIFITNINNSDQEDIYNKFNEKIKNILKKNQDQKEFIRDLYVMSTKTLLVNSIISKTKKENEFLFSLLPKYEYIFENGINSRKKLVDNFYNQVKNICSEGNVKINAENNTQQNILYDINVSYKKCLDGIIQIVNDFKTRNNYYWETKDLYLLEYYIDLYDSLLISELSEKDNEYFPKLSNLILSYINNRVITDTYDETLFSNKINEIMNKVNLQTNKILQKDYFMSFKVAYLKSKKIDDVQKAINNVSSNNNDLSEDNIINYRNLVFILFQLYLESENVKNNQKEDIDKLLLRLDNESTELDNFFLDIIKEIEQTSDIAEEIHKFTDNSIFLTESFDEFVDGQKYQVFELSDLQFFDSNDSDALLPDFINSPKKISYWTKYCATATLVGLVPNRWSTGLILPTGPLKLPVVYLAITSIKTTWGNIVIGLGICGIAISPLFLYNNFDLNTNSIVDLIAVIKNQIKNLIDININQIRNSLKNQLSDSTMRILEEQLIKFNIQIDDLKRIKTQNIIGKPVLSKITLGKLTEPMKEMIINKLRPFLPDKIINKINAYNPKDYKDIVLLSNEESELIIESYNQYNQEINNELDKIKKEYNKISDQVISSKKYIQSNINNYSDSTANAINTQINQIEKQINKTEEEIEKLYEDAESLLLASPFSLKGDSMSFGTTIKKPLPVNIIKEDVLINSINLEPVKEFIDNGIETLENKMFEDKETFKKLIQSSPLNSNILFKKIKELNPIITLKDNLPKYDNLSLTNILFTNYLLNDFTNTGSKTFGLPGFPPI